MPHANPAPHDAPAPLNAGTKLHSYRLIFFGTLVAVPEFSYAIKSAADTNALKAVLYTWGFPQEFQDDFFIGQDLTTAKEMAIQAQTANVDPEYPVSGCNSTTTTSIMKVIQYA